MNDSKHINQHYFLLFVVFLFLFVLYIFIPLPSVLRIIFGFVFIVLSMMGLYNYKHQLEHQEHALREEKDTFIVEVLRMQRHDMLNQVQLLQAYLQMGKYDKLQQCVDNINDFAEENRKIFSIGINSIMVKILNAKATWHTTKVTVDVDPLLEIQKFKVDVGQLDYLICRTLKKFQLFEKSSGEPNELQIGFHEHQEKLLVAFEYDGHYDTMEFRKQIQEIQQDVVLKHHFQFYFQLEQDWIYLTASALNNKEKEQ
ncbi:Spo0B domain-containing protein [Longirhabdus pacifica]|uniref:Spo0B domain-containing protein n=1 Tax=Longirhabdus pacifica TaxID=2305227 RepID=UPI0013E8D2D1|nr:Spo0B domain-containing protein [Longirhabdus pacifica]